MFVSSSSLAMPLWPTKPTKIRSGRHWQTSHQRHRGKANPSHESLQEIRVEETDIKLPRSSWQCRSDAVSLY